MRDDRSLDWRAITRGSLVGLAASLVLLGITSGLRHSLTGFTDSGAEKAVSLLALVCYFAGGYLAVGSGYRRAVIAGVLAGVLVACLGQVISFVFWFQSHHGHWLEGPRGEHPRLALIGPLVFGAAFGALGGLWARRRRSPA